MNKQTNIVCNISEMHSMSIMHINAAYINGSDQKKVTHKSLSIT